MSAPEPGSVPVARPGLNSDRIIEVAAFLADEIGFAKVTLARIAERCGVRAPSLYKHVESLADVQHGVATLAMVELDEQIRGAMLGKAGRDALVSLVEVTQSYVAAHPGRYSATVGAELTGPDDPLRKAGARVIEAISAVLRGYGIRDAELVHAIRTIRCALHGYAVLQATNAFQWSDDAAASLDWMVDFIDRGLTAVAGGERGESS